MLTRFQPLDEVLQVHFNCGTRITQLKVSDHLGVQHSEMTDVLLIIPSSSYSYNLLLTVHHNNIAATTRQESTVGSLTDVVLLYASRHGLRRTRVLLGRIDIEQAHQSVHQTMNNLYIKEFPSSSSSSVSLTIIITYLNLSRRTKIHSAQTTLIASSHRVGSILQDHITHLEELHTTSIRNVLVLTEGLQNTGKQAGTAHLELDRLRVGQHHSQTVILQTHHAVVLSTTAEGKGEHLRVTSIGNLSAKHIRKLVDRLLATDRHGRRLSLLDVVITISNGHILYISSLTIIIDYHPH